MTSWYISGYSLAFSQGLKYLEDVQRSSVILKGLFEDLCKISHLKDIVKILFFLLT